MGKKNLFWKEKNESSLSMRSDRNLKVQDSTDFTFHNPESGAI